MEWYEKCKQLYDVITIPKSHKGEQKCQVNWHNQVERRYSITAFIILFEKNDRTVSWKVKYNTFCLLGLSNLHNLKKTIGILLPEIDTNLAFCMYHRHASHNVHIYWFILMFFACLSSSCWPQDELLIHMWVGCSSVSNSPQYSNHLHKSLYH